MAARRMLSKNIIDSDKFYDLSLTSQALYLHLNLNADDDGFIVNAKRVLRSIGADNNDMQELLDNGYLIGFDSGIVVITHWKAHNYIPNDRYKASQLPEKQQLVLKKDNSYEKICIHDVYKMDTQDREGKDRLDKDSLGEGRIGKESIGESEGERKPNTAERTAQAVETVENSNRLLLGSHKNVELSQKELARLKLMYPIQWERMIDDLSDFMKTAGKTYDRHFDIITGWAGGAV